MIQRIFLGCDNNKNEKKGIIQKLSEDVINKIAAGEVIVRPSNALKELLENSIDAEATRIMVTCTNGGLKLLQISDNGSGIYENDLLIICERFTTSKLRHFTDLQTLTSFGFRGEALASMSHVAHVSIISSPNDSGTGNYCEYLNGCPTINIEQRPRERGTTIILKDMFYNLNVRRDALNPTEEYSKILSVMQKYAIHNPHISFICRRSGVRMNDLSTSGNMSITRPIHYLNTENTVYINNTNKIRNTKNDDEYQSYLLSVIKRIYGSSISSQLIPIFLTNLSPSFTIHGFITTSTVSTKQSCFILFINNRLVQHSTIKRCIESVFYDQSIKHQKPWVYLSMNVPSSSIDVNIHPTKNEVIFLDEDLILSKLEHYLTTILHTEDTSNICISQQSLISSSQILATMSNSQQSQTSLLTDETQSQSSAIEIRDEGPMLQDSPTQKPIEKKNSQQHLKPNHPVSCSTTKKVLRPTRDRTDNRQVTLKSFFNLNEMSHRSHSQLLASPCITDVSQHSSQLNDFERPIILANKSSFRDYLVSLDSQTPATVLRPFPNIHPLAVLDQGQNAFSDSTQLHSIWELKQSIVQNSSIQLTELIRQSIYIGSLDITCALVQSGTYLILINIVQLFKDAVYQSILYRLGQLPCMTFNPPISIRHLLETALNYSLTQDVPGHTVFPSTINPIMIWDTLKPYVPMLSDYFSIDINEEDQTLTQFPLCCGRYFPGIEALGELFINLTFNVQYSSEKECLSDISHVISTYYATIPKLYHDINTHSSTLQDDIIKKMELHPLVPNLHEFVFHPCLSLNQHFFASNKYDTGKMPYIQILASLDKLYTVFERC